VITTAIEGAFDYLDAPPQRVAVPDVPIPYSRPLEQFVLPDADKIADAAKELVGA
jgi:pyruvate/2-oxoglutarate/acetoin dehydrogenase E1 component